MLEYSSGNPKAIRAQNWGACARGSARTNLFRHQFYCSKLEDRIQLKFAVALQFCIFRKDTFSTRFFLELILLFFYSQFFTLFLLDKQNHFSFQIAIVVHIQFFSNSLFGIFDVSSSLFFY